MMVKILKCIAYEEVLRILNILDYKKKIKENELYEVLDIPNFEIHKFLKNLINLEALVEEEIDSETVYSFEKAFLKRYKFIEALLSDMKHENVFALDLKKF